MKMSSPKGGPRLWLSQAHCTVPILFVCEQLHDGHYIRETPTVASWIYLNDFGACHSHGCLDQVKIVLLASQALAILMVSLNGGAAPAEYIMAYLNKAAELCNNIRNCRAARTL